MLLQANDGPDMVSRGCLATQSQRRNETLYFIVPRQTAFDLIPAYRRCWDKMSRSRQNALE